MNDFIAISDFLYELPEEKIARYPLPGRDQSCLLIYEPAQIREDVFQSLDRYLPGHTDLYFNNTKVIHARLNFHKSTGANIEIFCLNPLQPSDYQLAFAASGTCRWQCMVGNLKKWKDDTLSLIVYSGNEEIRLSAKKIHQDGTTVDVEFSWDSSISFGALIETAGLIPIPPYLKRPSEDIDNTRYQTVYSRYDGSVAAPTAGLHFTTRVLENLKSKGIKEYEITLHVGAGTFQPVKSENIYDHRMHSEFFSLPSTIIAKLADPERCVVATGTTTLRTLESLYWLAVKSIESGKIASRLDQWEYRTLPQDYSKTEVFRKFSELLSQSNTGHFAARTGIMITPGYTFKVVEGLITNYHQPGSTLLLLIAAFIGEDWKKVYNYALQHDFRFLSYGDSSLLWRNPPLQHKN